MRLYIISQIGGAGKRLLFSGPVAWENPVISPLIQNWNLEKHQVLLDWPLYSFGRFQPLSNFRLSKHELNRVWKYDLFTLIIICFVYLASDYIKDKAQLEWKRREKLLNYLRAIFSAKTWCLPGLGSYITTY